MSDISDDELDEAVTLLAMLGGSSTSRGSSRRSSGGERKSNESPPSDDEDDEVPPLPEPSLNGIPLAQLNTPENREAALQKNAREKIQATFQRYIYYLKQRFSDQLIDQLKDKEDADDLLYRLGVVRKSIYEGFDDTVRDLNNDLKETIYTGKERLQIERNIIKIQDKIKKRKQGLFKVVGGESKSRLVDMNLRF